MVINMLIGKKGPQGIIVILEHTVSYTKFLPREKKRKAQDLASFFFPSTLPNSNPWS